MQKQVKLSDLVIDEQLVDIRPISPFTVSRYRQAYRAGNEFPTPIVDADTMIVVSGNHRVAAMRAEYGEDHKARVELRKFKTRADVLKTAAAENATHGLQLDRRSRTAMVHAMAREGVPAQEVAQIIGITVKSVEELAGMVMLVRGNGKTKCERVIPCKHGAEHMAGRTITEAEAERHSRRDRGIPVKALCRQLVAWLSDDGWVDVEDEATLAALDELAATLAEWKKRPVPETA